MIATIVGIFASVLMGTGVPVIDHVTDDTGAIHAACVDIGPTMCADGAWFSDDDTDGPVIVSRSDMDASPADTVDQMIADGASPVRGAVFGDGPMHWDCAATDTLLVCSDGFTY